MLDIHQQNDLRVYLEEEAISNVTNNWWRNLCQWN
jgi:hypothetical protein